MEKLNMKKIAYILGFDWIKSKPLKNAVRLAVNVGLVLASQTPQGAAIMALLGVTAPDQAAAIAAAGTALVEAIRTAVKAA
jgi:hypothetical protein